MTTTTVTEQLAQKAVAKFSFASHHFWAGSVGNWRQDALPYAERNIRRMVRELDSEARTQLLLEWDPTGYYASREDREDLRAVADMFLTDRLISAAAELVKPKS